MPTNKILILFAHPLYEKSHAHLEMVKHLPKSDAVTFHDLYESYPDFNIDIKKEQELLRDHDIIVWQHPMYWYSAPPILKQWIDLVLEYKWAYGTTGTALQGKYVFQAITTGGRKENYCDTGKDRFTIYELLDPFNQTAQVCQMHYLPPYVIHGTFQMEAKDYKKAGEEYGRLIAYLLDHKLTPLEFRDLLYLNDWFDKKK
jgi:glutathione-regulated potassium-efflux system ancillary protein KefG